MNSKLQATGRFAALRRDALRKVRQVGVLGTLQHSARKLFRDMYRAVAKKADPFDAKYGTDTARIISVGALDIPDSQLEHSNRYEAVVPSVFDAFMSALPIRHEEYTFVDVGSGKGRALLLATRLPFKEIVGVEISAALTEVAVENIRIFNERSRGNHAIRTVCSDAALYELPQGPAVLYLNNPFDAQIMRSFVSSVEKSVRASPRNFFIVYQRPLHRFLWDQSDCFTELRTTDRCVIYVSR